MAKPKTPQMHEMLEEAKRLSLSVPEGATEDQITEILKAAAASGNVGATPIEGAKLAPASSSTAVAELEEEKGGAHLSHDVQMNTNALILPLRSETRVHIGMWEGEMKENKQMMVPLYVALLLKERGAAAILRVL